jgi:hypothetical protein
VTQRRRWTAALCLAGVVAGLAACGGGDEEVTPEKAAAELDEACAEAAATIAALPAPTDAASFEAYQDAFTAASARVYTLAFELELDDVDRTMLAGALGQYRSLIGAWTPLSLAWMSQAVTRVVDDAATALGATACGTDTWQPPRWADYIAIDGHRQEADEFRVALGEVCRATIGSFTVSDKPGQVGNAVTGANATRAIGDFTREAGRLDPPAELAESFLDLLEPLVTLEALIPDVAVELSPERRQRIEDQGPTLDEALAALDVTCTG